MTRASRWLATTLLAIATPATAAAEPTSATRPDQFTIGIGAGWSLPADITNVDTLSVRFRFPCGLTLEPRLRATTSNTTIDVGGVDTKSSSSTVSLTSSVRWPLVRRGRADLILHGGAGFTYSKVDDWADHDTARNTTFGLDWGLAIDYWLSSNWSLSVTATNPLLSLSRASQEQPPPDDDTETSTTSFGATFDPTVVVMLHLFY